MRANVSLSLPMFVVFTTYKIKDWDDGTRPKYVSRFICELCLSLVVCQRMGIKGKRSREQLSATENKNSLKFNRGDVT